MTLAYELGLDCLKTSVRTKDEVYRSKVLISVKSFIRLTRTTKLNYFKTTKNILFIDVSASRRKPSVRIRKTPKTENMNRDEGSYQLSHVWDKFLHIDDRHRKSVLMKASDVKPKRR